MNENVRAGLSRRRWMRWGAFATLLGVLACFVVLVAWEREGAARVGAVKAALVVFVICHFASVAYLRMKRCPSCGERFLGTTRSAVGSYTAMTQGQCQHCGISL
ncbi:MAG TPA: hypothetical protein VJQ52_03885 [Steroidobacteraceae bacterium]|nr:hypothetical protein [Steroidobacteraceae bacterium]